MKSDLVDIACELRHETPRAWLINDGKREVWIPKSMAQIDDDLTAPTGYILTMPEWFAKKKELI